MKKHPYIVSDYLNKFARTLLGNRNIKDIATDIIEIAPGNETYHPKAIFLEEELARIKGVGYTCSLEGELKRIEEHTQEQRPVIAYKMQNILLHNGNFYANRFKHGLNSKNKTIIHSGLAEEYDTETTLSQTWLGSKFFGHFLHDDIPLNLLANEIGIASSIKRPHTTQQVELLNIFKTSSIELPETAYLKNITILSDYDYNESKINRWKKMRSVIQNTHPLTINPGVFLMRGSTGATRSLTNELELAEHLEKKYDFICINPGEAPTNKVIEAISNAQIVIGVDGSQVAHGIFGIKDTGAMLVLQPPDRFSNAFKDMMDSLGIKYLFHVCEEHNNGFKADINVIDYLIEKAN